MIVENNKFDLKNLIFEDMKLSSADMYSFSLDLPDFDSMLTNMFTTQDINKDMEDIQNMLVNIDGVTANNPVAQAQLVEAQKKLIESLHMLADKDQVPVNFKEIDDIKLHINAKDIYNLDTNYKVKMDSLTKDDLEFFKLCTEKKEITINDIGTRDAQINLTAAESSNQISYKSINVSKGLFNLIDYSYKKQKPFRLDFQGKSSVILKVNNEGKVSAEFIANDKAMEQVLKNSIPNLKNKLDSEGIEYEKIYYREKDNNKNKRNKGGPK